jgi:hypothetical protein
MFSSKKLLVTGLSIAALGLSACTTSQQISDILEKHPEVLANAIEKNPDIFMAAVQKAAQAAQGKAQQNEALA